MYSDNSAQRMLLFQSWWHGWVKLKPVLFQECTLWPFMSHCKNHVLAAYLPYITWAGGCCVTRWERACPLPLHWDHKAVGQRLKHSERDSQVLWEGRGCYFHDEIVSFLELVEMIASTVGWTWSFLLGLCLVLSCVCTWRSLSAQQQFSMTLMNMQKTDVS